MTLQLPPETLSIVFSYIDKRDIHTFYSIILVNKSWCTAGIRFLWYFPFNSGRPVSRLSLIIPFILSHLSQYTLSTLCLNNVTICRASFDYPSFIRGIDYIALCESIIRWWFDNNILMAGSLDIDGTDEETGDTIVERQLQVLNVICQMIFERSGRIFEFVVDMTGLKQWPYECAKRYIVELIKLPVSENALQHVKKFYYAEKAIQSEFIRQIEKCCTSIDEITTIQTSSTSTAFRQLAAFISRQKQLRKIEIRSTHALTNLSPLTRYLHQHRCSLTELVLSVGRLDEDALESIRECHNLERLTLHRIPLRSKHLRPVANAVFHSLRYLYVGDIDETWNVKSRDRPNNELITIIKLAKDTLDEIHLNVNLKYYNGLVKTIAGHCHKLKTFETCIQSTDQIQELFLLLKISQSLQTLSLSRRWNNVLFQSYRCILGIVNYIPKTLRRLDLKGMELGVSDVKMILDRCPHLMYMSWKCENFEREYENVVRKCAEKNARRVRKFGSKKLNERVRWMMEVEFEE